MFLRVTSTALVPDVNGKNTPPVINEKSSVQQDTVNILTDLNRLLKAELTQYRYLNAERIIDSAENVLNIDNFPSSPEKADFKYLKGALKYKPEENYPEALNLYEESIEIRRQVGDTFRIEYARSMYNAGLCSYYSGELIRAKHWYLAAIESYKSIQGAEISDVIDSYQQLAVSLKDLNDFQSAVEAIEVATNMAQTNYTLLSDSAFSLLYKTRGFLFYEAADYDNARINFEKAEDYYLTGKLQDRDLYLQILNYIATCYHYLGNKARMEEIFRRGIDLSEGSISIYSILLRQNYAIILGNTGKIDEGREMFSAILKQLQNKKDDYNHAYYYVALKYAEFLNGRRIDPNLALEILGECYEFYRNYRSGYYGRYLVPAYAQAFNDDGDYPDALRIIQDFFFPNDKAKQETPFQNPVADSIIINNSTLDILDLKYHALMGLYSDKGEIHYLMDAQEVSELIISMLETIRLNISEEESRLQLGDRYRDLYLHAISANVLLHNNTGDESYLNNTFIYGEKSKAAGLLAATREMKGIQFHIPEHLAEFEMDLQREIFTYSKYLKQEQDTTTPDATRLMNLRNSLLLYKRRKDSLNIELEKNYPDYYKLKYNTDVVTISDAPSLLRRKSNYISYIYSDTAIYVMLVNRRHQKIISVPVDTTFEKKIGDFRKMLLFPENASVPIETYRKFQTTGHQLYKLLIEPVREYLISDRIIISPDNILSFIPFEALLVSDPGRDDLYYRTLPYLFREYEISYAYSITLLSEKDNTSLAFHNNAIAFAPEYKYSMNADSVLNARQPGNKNILRSLPYAREEVRYVTDLTGGKYLSGDSATRYSFRKEAGSYDIVHLAMHALVNDEDPMYSKLVFGSEEDSVLLTSDIYGIPLDVKMVFLSACNTGFGKLHKGEGIISLARSFIYSGSRSVVMSLWEVDDRAGTEIVRSFYDRLIKGDSKGRALKEARTGFLKNAGMLEAHPYYWATLIIYGDDSPVYIPVMKIIISLLVFAAVSVAVIIYFRKRRYSA